MVQCHALQVVRLGSFEGRRPRRLLWWGAAFLFGDGAGAGRVDDSDNAV
ncbi:hypothetical protein ACP70R_028993 [Stipagrostis hirtigluma subsp. patula]